MSGGLQPNVSWRRGWGWVFGGGLVMTLLATVPALGGGVWWAVSSLTGLAWGLWYVPWVVGGLVAVAVAVLAVQMWRGRRW